MKNIYVIFSLLISTSTVSFAVMKDKKTIEKSVELAAKKKTFSTVGFVVDIKSGAANSGILIDPWTVLSVGHFAGGEGEIVFTLNPTIPVVKKNDNIQVEIDNSYKLTSKVVKFIRHPKYQEQSLEVFEAEGSEDDKVKQILLFLAKEYDRHRSLDDINSAMSWNDIFRNDIAIIKLKDPIEPPHGFLQLSQQTLEDSKSHEGYSLGYASILKTCEGEVVFLKNPSVNRLVLENTITYNEKNNIFFERHLSPFSKDGMFIRQNNKLYYGGLFSSGMSGGALLVKEGDNHVIGGINSMVIFSDFSDVLETSKHTILERRKDAENKEYYDFFLKAIDKYQKKIAEQSPIYNIWMPVAPYAGWIKENMGKLEN